jgi:ATP-dependent exoDNAse (exonuclease V) beta subunit
VENLPHHFCAESPDHRLYLIGDPKQAIYGFRGADVNTYLAAAETAKSKYSLDTNWRSESALVNAVNTVFEAGDKDTAFVEPHISFEPVQAAERADAQPCFSCSRPNVRRRFKSGAGIADQRTVVVQVGAKDDARRRRRRSLAAVARRCPHGKSAAESARHRRAGGIAPAGRLGAIGAARNANSQRRAGDGQRV